MPCGGSANFTAVAACYCHHHHHHHCSRLIIASFLLFYRWLLLLPCSCQCSCHCCCCCHFGARGTIIFPPPLLLLILLFLPSLLVYCCLLNVLFLRLQSPQPANGPATALAVAITPLLLAALWCCQHFYCCCLLPSPLSVPPVDCYSASTVVAALFHWLIVASFFQTLPLRLLRPS